MIASNKFGRFTWISYLIGASPVAIFCCVMWIACLFVLPADNIGPIDVAPSPFIERFLMISSFIALPVVWILSITIAHRFNTDRLAIIPYIANIIPVLGFLWFAYIMRLEEGSDFTWMMLYASLLLTLLVLGFLTVIIPTNIQHNENQ